MAAATPPPPSARARTPPTPLHGARYDTYEPYSPRRSKRSTAHNNPYSSFNSDRSPKRSHILDHSTPPPTTIKKARFARAPTQLSSPPSSPTSPVRRSRPSLQQPSIHKEQTPRKTPTTYHSKPTPSSSRHLAPPTTLDPATMLPTPSKTPSKKPHRPGTIHSTARILSFQPNHPNDVMPSPRRIKSHQHQARPHNQMGGDSMLDFDLYDDDDEARGADGIEIYTDVNARVPVLDEGEDNPFVGPKTTGRAKRGAVRGKGRTEAQQKREAEIQDAVRREEGVAYVFRGKTIFRRFEADSASPPAAATSPTTSTPHHQRLLKRQAGAAAQRPLTRSALKPRLLFPSEDQVREREGEVDEEAETDVDLDAVDLDEGVDVDVEMGDASAAPAAVEEGDDSPPRGRTKGKGRVRGAGVGVATPSPVSDDEDGGVAVGGGGTRSSGGFETWQRTKAGKKRAGEIVSGVAEGEAVGRGKKARRVGGA